MWNVGEGFRVAAPIRSDGIVGHFSTYPGRQQTGVQRIVKYLCFWSTTTTTTTTTATKKTTKTTARNSWCFCCILIATLTRCFAGKITKSHHIKYYWHGVDFHLVERTLYHCCEVWVEIQNSFALNILCSLKVFKPPLLGDKIWNYSSLPCVSFQEGVYNYAPLVVFIGSI